MKPILYAGVALMVCAAIYGFVEYKNPHATEEAVKNEVVPVKEKAVQLPSPETKEKRLEPASIKEEVKEPGKTKETRNDKAEGKREKTKRSEHELFSRAPLKDVPEISADGKTGN